MAPKSSDPFWRNAKLDPCWDAGKRLCKHLLKNKRSPELKPLRKRIQKLKRKESEHEFKDRILEMQLNITRKLFELEKARGGMSHRLVRKLLRRICAEKMFSCLTKELRLSQHLNFEVKTKGSDPQKSSLLMN